MTECETGRSLCVASIVLVVFLLGGCSTVKLDYAPPPGFNLSGAWVLDQEMPSVDEPRGRRSGFLTQDFPLLVTRNLRIEQDAASMGVEYARGSYRDVSWGERRRGIWEVQAGWHEGALHIYSESADTSAHETYQLLDSGQRLSVTVYVDSGGRKQNFSRLFVRESKI